MGKKKVGKQRKDKFYHLAKESGFRSRAAFKLLQLNRKYEFLQKAQVLVDLCAAPGGWMQVAKQNMPLSSIVLGVDLFPIKPIPGCISLLGDITTDKCRVDISKELKTWKADVVLHDGAPNVGQNWNLDAYNQITLTLSAFKLSLNFLKKGGWFITKVFRSKDYNSMMWVLNQFFKEVHATKPQASRNESAEIFVICQYYLAPDKIDPKLTDPKYVFSELQLSSIKTAHLLQPEKHIKKRAFGYPDDFEVYKEVKASEFLSSNNPIMFFKDTSCLKIDDKRILEQEETTDEIKECCKDLKVLGRIDLKKLLEWAKVLKQRLYSEIKEEEEEKDEKENVELKNESDVKEDILDEDDEELNKVEEKIKLLEDEERRELKRKRKKANKARAKLKQQLDLKMIHKGDDGPTEEDQLDSMFSLKQISTRKKLSTVTDQTPDVLAESASESEDDEPPPYKSRSVPYIKGNTQLDSSGIFYKSDESQPEDSDAEEDDVEDEGKVGLGFNEDHPLISDLDFRDKQSKRLQKAQLWFEKDVFKDLETDKIEEYELDKLVESVKKKGGRIIGNMDESEEEEEEEEDDDDDDEDDIKDDNKENISEKSSHLSNADGSEESSDTSDSEYDEAEQSKRVKKIANKTGEFEIVQGTNKLKKRKLDEEGLAIGSVMVGSRKKRRDIIDAGWNRYAFNDTNLPAWFVEDETYHMKKPTPPVPKELVDEYAKKKEELNVRPIKKVIEAKARKKKRVIRKLERAKKKMEGILDNPDVPEAEKARQLQKLYKRAENKKKPEVTYVVAKKFNSGKRVPRPKGVKGRYKVVDPRMKKDLRKQKAMEKTNKKSGRARMKIMKKKKKK